MHPLISEIENAFANIKLEEGISLNMTEYLDSYQSRKEFSEAAKWDEREDWKTISDGVLQQFTAVFSFTDCKGFLFYLPAYMRWKINNPLSSAIIGDHTIYSLDPDAIEKSYGKKITGILTVPQLETIIKFLEWCCFQNTDYCDSDYALSNLIKLKSLVK